VDGWVTVESGVKQTSCLLPQPGGVEGLDVATHEVAPSSLIGTARGYGMATTLTSTDPD